MSHIEVLKTKWEYTKKLRNFGIFGVYEKTYLRKGEEHMRAGGKLRNYELRSAQSVRGEVT